MNFCSVENQHVEKTILQTLCLHFVLPPKQLAYTLSFSRTTCKHFVLPPNILPTLCRHFADPRKFQKSSKSQKDARNQQISQNQQKSSEINRKRRKTTFLERCKIAPFYKLQTFLFEALKSPKSSKLNQQICF